MGDEHDRMIFSYFKTYETVKMIKLLLRHAQVSALKFSVIFPQILVKSVILIVQFSLLLRNTLIILRPLAHRHFIN